MPLPPIPPVFREEPFESGSRFLTPPSSKDRPPPPPPWLSPIRSGLFESSSVISHLRILRSSSPGVMPFVLDYLFFSLVMVSLSSHSPFCDSRPPFPFRQMMCLWPLQFRNPGLSLCCFVTHVVVSAYSCPPPARRLPPH